MYNEVKLKLQIFLSTIIFFVTVLLFQQFVLPQLLNEGDLISFFAGKTGAEHCQSRLKKILLKIVLRFPEFFVSNISLFISPGV